MGITGTLHEDVRTFMILSRSFILIMESVLDKSYRENQNMHFMFNNFLPTENFAFYETT